MSPSYKALRLLVYALARFAFRLQVKGREHLPEQGAVLIFSNHISNLDPVILGSVIPRRVSFMAKEELFHHPLLGAIIRRFGAFPVRRGMSDTSAMKKGLQILREGRALILFPEGHRSRDGKIGKPYPGVAMFALRSEAVAVPVAIVGRYRLFGRTTVAFGPPVDLTWEKEHPKQPDLLQTTAERMMKQVQCVMEGCLSETY